jgi:hypothetical protein
MFVHSYKKKWSLVADGLACLNDGVESSYMSCRCLYHQAGINCIHACNGEAFCGLWIGKHEADADVDHEDGDRLLGPSLA